MSGTRAISTTSRRELPSSFFFLQGKAPKEIHAILTETLACFLPGRSNFLSAPLHRSIFIFWGENKLYIIKVKLKWSRYRPGVAQRVGRGIALLFHDTGTRRVWLVSSTPRPHFTPGKDPVPILQEVGWAPGLVWTGAKNLVPTGIRSRTVQPVAQSGYRLKNLPPSCAVVMKSMNLNFLEPSGPLQACNGTDLYFSDSSLH